MDDIKSNQDTTLKAKKKSAGRPKGTGSANKKLLRVFITPRQERLLTILREQWGLSESEHARRALDDYLDDLLKKGEFVDPGPAKPPE